METEIDTKKCPYCAETIKAEAIVCRFCGRDLTEQVAPISADQKSNAALVWSAIVLIVIVCPLLSLNDYPVPAIIAAVAGLCLLIYAMATGQLKLFG
jgi:hypothetical protein